MAENNGEMIINSLGKEILIVHLSILFVINASTRKREVRKFFINEHCGLENLSYGCQLMGLWTSCYSCRMKVMLLLSSRVAIVHTISYQTTSHSTKVDMSPLLEASTTPPPALHLDTHWQKNKSKHIPRNHRSYISPNLIIIAKTIREQIGIGITFLTPTGL